MRNRDAWLAAIAATLGISEEACRREAASQAQQVVAAASSSSAQIVADTAPSASADVTPSAAASASASPITSASAATVAKPPSSVDPAQHLLEMSQAICGAVPKNVNRIPGNGSCGASVTTNPGIGNLHNACGGGPPPRNDTVAPPRAEVTVMVNGGAAGDDRVAMSLRPRFRACANQALVQDPTMQGKLVVLVSIAANGEVTKADVASNSGVAANATQCMLRGVKNAQFAAGAARTITLALSQTKQSP